MIKIVGVLGCVWQYIQQSDVVRQPCASAGVSPSMHKALSCFTGAFLTGQNVPLLSRYGLKSTTLTATVGVILLRVERPSSENRSKESRITFPFPLHQKYIFSPLLKGGVVYV